MTKGKDIATFVLLQFLVLSSKRKTIKQQEVFDVAQIKKESKTLISLMSHNEKKGYRDFRFFYNF